MTVNLESQDVWKLILRGQETDKEQVRKGDNALAGLYEVYTPLWWTKFGTLVLRTWAQTKNFPCASHSWSFEILSLQAVIE